jgi:3'-phosphoadenosine 5'-phosphosulfate sulfotransferase
VVTRRDKTTVRDADERALGTWELDVEVSVAEE